MYVNYDRDTIDTVISARGLASWRAKKPRSDGGALGAAPPKNGA